MEVSPATGKILGMLMAYAVSALGLLLAYYNYRKRIVKAERIFTPAARAVLGAVVALVLVGAILGAAAASAGPEAGAEAVRDRLLGILIPAAIIAVSFALTWGLYRHFSKKLDEEGHG